MVKQKTKDVVEKLNQLHRDAMLAMYNARKGITIPLKSAQNLTEEEKRKKEEEKKNLHFDQNNMPGTQWY